MADWGLRCVRSKNLQCIYVNRGFKTKSGEVAARCSPSSPCHAVSCTINPPCFEASCKLCCHACVNPHCMCKSVYCARWCIGALILTFSMLCLDMGLMCVGCMHSGCRRSSCKDLSRGCWAVQGVSGQVKERIELAARTGPDPNLRPLLLFPEVRKQDHLVARSEGRPLRHSQEEKAWGTCLSGGC